MNDDTISEKDSSSIEKIEREDRQKGSSSFFMTLANTVNAEVGNGIIALAATAQIAGPGLCMVLTVLFGLVTAYTTYVLSLVAEHPGPKTYGGLVERHLGTIFYTLFTACNIAFPLSLCILYSVALSVNIQNVFLAYASDWPVLCNRTFILACFSLFIALPTSLLPDVSFLQNISVISLILVCFYTAVFVARAPLYSARVLVLPEFWDFALPGVFQALGALALSFTVHQGVLHLFRSMRNGTLRRFTVMLNISVAMSTSFYFLVMTSQYIAFAGVVVSNAIENYCRTDTLMNVTTLFLSASLAATMPLQVIFLRDTIVLLVVRLWKPVPYLRYYVGFGVTIFVFTISILLKSIMAILVIGGAISGGPLNLIFPCLLYIVVVHGSFRAINVQTVFNWVLILIGISVTILGTSMALWDAIVGTDLVGFPMYWCDDVIF